MRVRSERALLITRTEPPAETRSCCGPRFRDNGSVAMRTDCKHYESRTYQSGDIVRKCRIDLAPEAPWKCPDDCPGYERRMIDAGWQYGSLSDAQEPEPEPEMGGDVAALLDEAEDIVNAAGAQLLDEQARKQRKGLFRKNKRKRR
jgi:hypothetical protein